MLFGANSRKGFMTGGVGQRVSAMLLLTDEVLPGWHLVQFLVDGVYQDPVSILSSSFNRRINI